ncbi:DUF4145 domain-containing protein [Lactobacillus amylovorus]|uniref:DUF4145 domain-containing protein n=1 Tax=Lactobacillus amylovorus TaxID=1604 RepID=UPI003D0245E2
MSKKSSVPYVLLITIEDQLQDIIPTKNEIIDLTRAFAQSVGKEVPIDTIDFDLTKKDILRQNLDCLSDDEKFDFMSQIQKLSYVKCRPELEEEITNLLSYQDRITGSKDSRNSISGLLAAYPPKIRKQWTKACIFFDKDDYRNALDNVRLAVELLVKELTKSDASLENQQKNLGNFLKAKGIGKQVRNYLHNILNIYEKIQNNEVKHDVPESLSREEVTFIMNQSYVLIKFLVDCDNKAF